MKQLSVLIAILFVFAAFKSDKPAYRLFNKEGKKVKYDQMLDVIAQADVVFFGEQHNNPICHWLQLAVTQDLYQLKRDQLMLGAEMFERDNQLIVNEYLGGDISDKSFKKEARIWPNYGTDYAPLLEFSKDSNIKFIATNIPRRYASLVYSKGLEALDSLSAEAKGYMAPLPIEYNAELKCYKDMLAEMEAMGHANENLPKAQAIKDATMAYSIAAYAEGGKSFLHFNGAYHSDNFSSIIWYLNKYKPGLKIVTISSVEQPSVSDLEDENTGKADFILVVPNTMTKTH